MIHDWHIEEQEYARHESRRGRRHAFEWIDPAHTALVVVDMVPFFVEENPYCRGILPNVARLATTLRDAGGTVAWVLPGKQDPRRSDSRLSRGPGGRRVRCPRDEVHNATLRTVYRSFGDVRSTAEVIDLIGQ